MITKDVAALLGVSNARVKALVKEGRLIPIKSEENVLFSFVLRLLY